MLGPRLQLTRYVSRLDEAFLFNYISKLGMLHKDYQGITLSTRDPAPIDPRPVEAIVDNIMALLSAEKVTHLNRVCRHEVVVQVVCGSFSWEMEIKRFSIQMRTFIDVIGSYHTEDDGFTEAYGDENELLHGVARSWIEQGVCNTVSLARNVFCTLSDGWGAYLFSKMLRDHFRRQPRYDGRPPRPVGDVLDLWGEFSADRRAEISNVLDTFESSVKVYRKDLLQYSGSINEMSAFFQGVDVHLLNLFGEERFSEMLSILGSTLDLWVEDDNFRMTSAVDQKSSV